MILAALLALALPSIELDAVGDIMLARHVERRIEREGSDSPYRDVAAILRHADIAVGNLECVLGDAPYAVRKLILLRAKPQTAAGLQRGGFGLLTVANNHSLDCGSEGLGQAKAALEHLHVVLTGVSLDPTIVERKGIRLAFFGVCQFHPDPHSLLRAIATPDIVYADNPGLLSAVSNARNAADIVIVMIHWGEEENPRPNEFQLQFARKLADAGVDLILGCHPHVLQPVVWLKASSARKCLVAYSLGNFIFDARPGADSTSEILRVTITKRGIRGFSTEPVAIRASFPTLSRHHSTHSNEGAS